ncbi:MAG: PAS-domain containing protein [Rhodospirillales bacterium]|nr:PAS-domain containing protein [Rhodospirillales bacterium]
MSRHRLVPRPTLAGSVVAVSLLALLSVLVAAAATGQRAARSLSLAGLLPLLALTFAAAILLFRRRSRAILRDREELRQANRALAAAKAEAEAKTAQLEGMLANMSDGVSLIDGEMHLKEWNALFSERTGVPKELLRPGMTMEEILRIQARLGEFGPGDVEAFVAERMKRVRDRTHLGVIERLRPNGMTIELRRSLMPDGGFVTLYANVTARKQAEAAKRLAQEAAEAATAAKAEFVATVAHEVRSPLNAVINGLDLLGASGLGTAQQKLVEAARGAGDALRTLITDILDIARMDAGQFRLAPEDFALRPLLLSIIDMFRSEAEGRGQAIALELAPDLPDNLHADPRRLRQVLLNFLSNAVKFSSPGTITLEVVAESSGEWRNLTLSVMDPGPPIPDADRRRLFQPFQRLENATTSPRPGSGLGLAISERLVRLMGGTIGCEPFADGNRFWLTIPLAPARQDTSLPEAPPRHRPIRRARILVVEDVPANQLVLATMLRRDGHLVDIAASGEAALAALCRHPYDIAFLDLHLPGINGFETARRIRALPGPGAKIPLVGLTAAASADTRTRCLEVGMDEMIGKPVSQGALAATLAAQLRPHESPARSAAALAAEQVASPAAPGLDLARLAALRRELPPGLLATLAEECLTDIGGRLPQLRAALAAGRAPEAGSIAHAIAGTAATYGLSKLAALARDLSNAARQGNPDANAINPIEAEYRDGATTLRALLTA